MSAEQSAARFAVLLASLLVLVPIAAQAQPMSVSSTVRAAELAYWKTCFHQYGVCGVAPGSAPPDQSAAVPTVRDGADVVKIETRPAANSSR